MSRFFEGVGATCTGVMTLLLAYTILDGSIWNPQIYTFSDGALAIIALIAFGGITLFLGWPKND